MCRYSVHSSVLLLLIMICNISYCANRDDFLCTLFSDFKLKAIVVINPYGIKAIIKCLKVERIEHKRSSIRVAAISVSRRFWYFVTTAF